MRSIIVCEFEEKNVGPKFQENIIVQLMFLLQKQKKQSRA